MPVEQEFTIPIAVTDNLLQSSYSVNVNVYQRVGSNTHPKCVENLSFNLEDIEVGDFIGRLTAIDNDRGLNGLLRYHLLTKSENVWLNEASGRLTLTGQINNSITLNFLVSDHGSPTLSARCSATLISLNNSNDSPTSTQPVYYKQISHQDLGKILAVNVTNVKFAKDYSNFKV